MIYYFLLDVQCISRCTRQHFQWLTKGKETVTHPYTILTDFSGKNWLFLESMLWGFMNPLVHGINYLLLDRSLASLFSARQVACMKIRMPRGKEPCFLNWMPFPSNSPQNILTLSVSEWQLWDLEGSYAKCAYIICFCLPVMIAARFPNLVTLPWF